MLRRAAREREELTVALLGDDSTPEAAAVAHSAPLWLARMWWEELGAEDARSLLAACNEPAEVAMRVDTTVAPRSRRKESDMDACERGAPTLLNVRLWFESCAKRASRCEFRTPIGRWRRRS